MYDTKPTIIKPQYKIFVKISKSKNASKGQFLVKDLKKFCFILISKLLKLISQFLEIKPIVVNDFIKKLSLNLYTKNGLFCKVPEIDLEDTTPKFELSFDNKNAIKYYKENGYVVIKKVISSENCDLLIKSWNEEVKPFKGHIIPTSISKIRKK